MSCEKNVINGQQSTYFNFAQSTALFTHSNPSNLNNSDNNRLYLGMWWGALRTIAGRHVLQCVIDRNWPTYWINKHMIDKILNTGLIRLTQSISGLTLKDCH